MRASLRATASGPARGPTRAVLELQGAWFATMPASVTLDDLSGLGAKLVTAFPRNAGRGLATHQAIVAMFDPETGAPLGLVAGETITERRTAAVSVVATERLAKRPRGTLAILGAGAQGRSHLEAFLDAGLIERLQLWSRHREHAEALAAIARANDLAAVVVAADPASAVQGADVIVTATSTAEPLFEARDLADGAHVNAVGSCVPSRRELPADLIDAANLYVDSIDAAWRESGDLLLAASELGRERVRICAELGTMLAEPERGDPDARATIFKSLGLGIEDVACAAYVLSRIA
jgi:ornithine cyclodeaminase